MEFIADLHIHSKYSRATSRNMDVKSLSEWAKLKGITLMAPVILHIIYGLRN